MLFVGTSIFCSILLFLRENFDLVYIVAHNKFKRKKSMKEQLQQNITHELFIKGTVSADGRSSLHIYSRFFTQVLILDI
jgi:hypothetical protein